jgi:hypothetical protein
LKTEVLQYVAQQKNYNKRKEEKKKRDDKKSQMSVKKPARQSADSARLEEG